MNSALLNFNDEELWNEIRLNNYEAFEVIHQKYSTLLYNSAFAIIKEKETCEDIVQDVFINIWSRRGHLNIHSIKSYLLKSTRNQVLIYFRKHKHFIDLEMIENNVATYYSIEKNLSDKNEINDIYRKLDALPEKCKEIFLLSRKYQLSNKEISDKLKISVKTVENQITIAIKKLKPAAEKMYLLVFLILIMQITSYIQIIFGGSL